MLKQTALNAAHRAMGAKMVDFSGWDMPLHYGSQIEEHHQVRRDAGMFDVSHMLAIDVEGALAREFLRRLLANNIDRLQIPGKAMYSCLLNEQGGVLDDLIVYYLREDWYRIVVTLRLATRIWPGWSNSAMHSPRASRLHRDGIARSSRCKGRMHAKKSGKPCRRFGG